jgi:hypothetical protein
MFMDLSNNDLSGDVPTSANSNFSLESLHLASNRFTREFPSVLRNMNVLSVLDLGENYFSGTIPPWILEALPLLRILRLRSTC